MRPGVRSDAERLGELIADDFLEYGSSGRIFSKAAIIAALRDEVRSRISLMEFKVTLLGDGVALTTYRSMREVHETVNAEALRSSIWILRDGRWQVRFHQGTKVTPGMAG